MKKKKKKSNLPVLDAVEAFAARLASVPIVGSLDSVAVIWKINTKFNFYSIQMTNKRTNKIIKFQSPAVAVANDVAFAKQN